MGPAFARRSGLLARGAHQLRLFFVALQFFTRVPIPRWVGFEEEWLHHASRYFPAVGLVVGAFAAAVYWLAAMLWPPLVAVLLSTAATVYLTGAFHEDGFADTCDGFGGGTSRQRVLDIMSDSRVGAYGAIGIGLLLALKCAVLSSLAPAFVASGLLLGHSCSRLAATALIWRLDYAKGEGKSKPLARQMSGAEFAIAALAVLMTCAALLAIGCLRWQTFVALAATVALATAWLARMFRRRIGGYTGDCLGAVQQVTEVAIYLVLLAGA